MAWKTGNEKQKAKIAMKIAGIIKNVYSICKHANKYIQCKHTVI